MSDYTPTTEDMREVFVAAVRLSFKDVGASAYSIIRGVTHGGAWFDSWLAEEIRAAKAELLEKIIEDFDSTSFYRYADGSEGHFIHAHQLQVVRDRLRTYTEES